MRTHREINEDLKERVAAARKGKLVWQSTATFQGTDDNGVIRTYKLPGRTLVYPEGGRAPLRKLKPAIRDSIRDFYLAEHGAYAPASS